MNVEPAFEKFAATYDAGKPQVVWTRLIADLETPVSALLKLADGSTAKGATACVAINDPDRSIPVQTVPAATWQNAMTATDPVFESARRCPTASSDR